MKAKYMKINKIWLTGLAVLLIIITWGGLFTHPAISQQVESRLNNLESDFNRLESRLNQIESLLNRTSPSSPNTPSIPPQSPLNRRRNISQSERDKMFERLATLVIETRQDLNKLQARVSKLESRR